MVNKRAGRPHRAQERRSVFRVECRPLMCWFILLTGPAVCYCGGCLEGQTRFNRHRRQLTVLCCAKLTKSFYHNTTFSEVYRNWMRALFTYLACSTSEKVSVKTCYSLCDVTKGTDNSVGSPPLNLEALGRQKILVMETC